MKQVLLIERDFYLRVRLDDQLAEHGFQVTTVRSARDALLKMRTQMFQTVIMSYEDDIDQALRMLATLRQANNKIPVIFMTKVPQAEHLVRLMEFSPISMVVKPYNLVDLLQRLEHTTKQAVE